jgi:hypothetical protein
MPATSAGMTVERWFDFIGTCSRKAATLTESFSILQTGERYGTVIVSCISYGGHTDTLPANHPKTGGPEFPENRENNREF